MSTVNVVKSRTRSFVYVFASMVIGVFVGVFLKEPFTKIINLVGRSPLEDYELKEVKVDYLQMLEGANGITVNVINGVTFMCKCIEAHPENEQIVYRFQGYIRNEMAQESQKFRFNYVVKPIIKNGLFYFLQGEISRIQVEPENSVANCDAMKRLIEVFAVPQFMSLGMQVPDNAFAIKDLYSNVAVVKVSKEK